MKRLAFIIAIIMAAGAMSACSQTEKGTEPIAEITEISTTATPSEVPKSRINTDVSDVPTAETQNTEKSPVSAFQEPTGVCPTSPQKAGVGQMSPKQGGNSENGERVRESNSSSAESSESSENAAPKQSGNSQSSTPKTSERPQDKPALKPTEAPQPTKAPEPEYEPPVEKKELDYNQVVNNLIAYGQQLGMIYNGSLGLGAGWFPPTDISGYTDADAASAACYGDVEYVTYYYSGLGAEPSDITFNVIASDGQIYVVYA